jgi:hypothetical protein
MVCNWYDPYDTPSAKDSDVDEETPTFITRGSHSRSNLFNDDKLDRRHSQAYKRRALKKFKQSRYEGSSESP